MTSFATVQLENADANWTKNIKCTNVQVNMNRNNDATPDQETAVVADVVETTFENPTYTLQSWQLHPNISNALTVSDVQSLHTQNSTELYLIVKYGSSQLPGGERTLSSTQSAYTDKIPVKIQQIQFNINASDSMEGYVPTGSITLIEHRGKNTTI